MVLCILPTGDTYFLYEAETGNEYNGWNFNSIGDQGPHTYSINSGPYATYPDTQGAFSVQVEPVPETSPVVSFGLLLILGLSGVLLVRRKQALSD